MGVQFSYDLVGAGWANCAIGVDDASATVTASYLSDALDDLASAVSATLRTSTRNRLLYRRAR